jgi:hypothetical protein
MGKCRMWVSRSGVYDEYRLLGHNAAQSGAMDESWATELPHFFIYLTMLFILYSLQRAESSEWAIGQNAGKLVVSHS